MTFARRLGFVYLRIGRIYRSWAPSLLALALAVFLPLGLLDAISASYNAEAIDLDSGLKVAALLGALAALTTTSLLGEVFYSGAVAIFLTHPQDERPPPLRTVARHIDYRRLILVDVVYVAIVLVGFVLAFVPGLLAFVFLGLAGPVVEIEGRTVRGALARSFQLVRGSFAIVAFVLIPIEVVGEAVGDGLARLVHGVLGHEFIGNWIAEVVSNVALSPIFAVAAVLLTLDLIANRCEDAPALNPRPAPATR